MPRLLLLLLVSSLLTSSLASFSLFFMSANQKFMKLHSYRSSTLVDCNRDLNPILKFMKKGCETCNTFILGEKNYVTDMSAVDQVCSTNGGVYKGKAKLGKDFFDEYESKNEFRVVKCELDHSDEPPYCTYKKVEEADVTSTKITVLCAKNRAAHLPPCSPAEEEPTLQ